MPSSEDFIGSPVTSEDPYKDLDQWASALDNKSLFTESKPAGHDLPHLEEVEKDPLPPLPTTTATKNKKKKNKKRKSKAQAQQGKEGQHVCAPLAMYGPAQREFWRGLSAEEVEARRKGQEMGKELLAVVRHCPCLGLPEELWWAGEVDESY